MPLSRAVVVPPRRQLPRRSRCRRHQSSTRPVRRQRRCQLTVVRDLPANEFYPLLFADTAQSVLTLRKTLHDIDGADATVAFWFDFAWTLADGTPAPFTAVDVAELDDTGRITHLHIVYDTHPIREAWEAQQQLSNTSA